MTASAAIAQAMAHRQMTRAAQLLDGIVMGMLADGEINDQEVLMLSTWLTQNAEAASVWPGSAILQAVREVLADGVITAVEREHLLSQLKMITGSDFAETGTVTPDPVGIPYDENCAVTLRDAGVCMTGEFVFGTRSACERVSEKAGATLYSNVSKKVHFLVVGTRVSPNWISESYGRKIQAAMELRANGHHIAVIPEKRWVEVLAVA